MRDRLRTSREVRGGFPKNRNILAQQRVIQERMEKGGEVK